MSDALVSGRCSTAFGRQGLIGVVSVFHRRSRLCAAHFENFHV